MQQIITATATKLPENPFVFGNNYLRAADNRHSIPIPRYTSSLRKSVGDKIEEYSKYYDILNLKEISDYIVINTEVVDILEEAFVFLKRYFGNKFKKLTLRLVHDPEIINEKYLVVDISTKLSPLEALKKLDNFDENWWLDKVEEFDNNLIFNIDFI